MVPDEGIEPPTFGLQNRCSTAELCRRRRSHSIGGGGFHPPGAAARHGVNLVAARLLGTSVILVGISPELAQTMVQLGIDLSGILTFSTMRAGLAFARAAGAQGLAREVRR